MMPGDSLVTNQGLSAVSSDFELVSPCWLLLAIPVVILFVWTIFRPRGAIRYSYLRFADYIKQSFRGILYSILPVITMLGLLSLVVATSRPRQGLVFENREIEAVDIALVLDISGSMRLDDLKPINRLGAAKSAAVDFISGREYDRIGLVVFATDPLVMCPLTLDREYLYNSLEEVQIGMIEERTAIGTALGTGLNLLRPTDTKSKVVILLTDGISNTGQIDPITAAKAARALEIKVYTIGVGKRGKELERYLQPGYSPEQFAIDEKTLTEIARMTGGRYYRATDTDMLKNIFSEIDEMEKTIVKTEKQLFHKELHQHFILAGMALLLLAILLKGTIFRKVP